MISAAGPSHATKASRHTPVGMHLLVATTGASTSDAAVRIAHRLARRDGGTLELFGVLDPVPAYAFAFAEAAVPDLEDEREAALQLGIQHQLGRMAEETQWPVTTLVGTPAESIREAAVLRHATMVVLGIGRHRPLDRLLGHEVALEVALNCDAPVLAVAPDATSLPRSAVVGVDFSPASEAAAIWAAILVGDQGSVTLAHVRPAVAPAGHDGRVGWADLYAEAAADRLNSMQVALASRGVRVNTQLLDGNAAAALLTAAADADVIALGGHATTAVERLVAGSVITRILRGSTKSVLVARP